MPRSDTYPNAGDTPATMSRTTRIESTLNPRASIQPRSSASWQSQGMLVKNNRGIALLFQRKKNAAKLRGSGTSMSSEAVTAVSAFGVRYNFVPVLVFVDQSINCVNYKAPRAI